MGKNKEPSTIWDEFWSELRDIIKNIDDEKWRQQNKVGNFVKKQHFSYTKFHQMIWDLKEMVSWRLQWLIQTHLGEK